MSTTTAGRFMFYLLKLNPMVNNFWQFLLMPHIDASHFVFKIDIYYLYFI